jgi:uncharacterized membrane protein YccC
MRLADLRRFLVDEARQLASVNRSDRPWEMPVAAALASGVPIFVGAAYGEPGLGLAGSLGGLVFLHQPPTRLSHRMAWVMASAFGMIGSHALGMLGHLYPPLVIPLLVFITIVVTMVCRFYAAPPPGSLFFVMAASIAAYSPVHGRDALAQVGAVALGAVLAVALAFVYSLRIVRRRGETSLELHPHRDFDAVVSDSIVIGGFVGLALLVAHALQLERPYWVPVSCLAIIQGSSLRAAWTRQLHRIIGTALGLLVFLGIAQIPLGPWSVAIAVTALTLVVETLVVRHYALAVAFITPLAILLAEAGRGSMQAPQDLMQARLIDTVIGAVLGLIGAACLHTPRFRAAFGSGVRKLLPGAPRDR